MTITRYRSLVDSLEELQRTWIVSAHALKTIPVSTDGDRSLANAHRSALEKCIVELDEILKCQDYGPEEGGRPHIRECPGCGSRGEVHRRWCSDLGANTLVDP